MLFSVDALQFGTQISASTGVFGVHSVFDNSLNLIQKESLSGQSDTVPVILTLTHGLADMQGCMILLRSNDFYLYKQQVNATTLVTVKPDVLSSHTINIRLPEQNQWQTYPLRNQIFSGQQLALVMHLLQMRIKGIDQKIWHEAYQKIIHLFRFYQQTGDIESLTGMLGLGIGLTPSGDDFLLGYFASLHAKNAPEAQEVMQKIIEKSLKTTTTLSQHFLFNAANGFFNQALINFNHLTEEADRTQITHSLTTVLKKGATSGLDTALGYIAGLTGQVIT